MKECGKIVTLLVHHVNGDFSLSAYRKLRDVLIGFIIDGAFVGGMHYFEKEI